MKTINVGIIGCGGIAHGHIRRLSEMDEVKVSALVDIDPEQIAALQKKLKLSDDLSTYEDYREMLAGEMLDAVVICTPHTTHFDQIMDALDKGLHVLTEKPMVCTVERAKRVIEAAEESGKVVMVSYQRHFDPSFVYMREAISRGEIGEVQFISAIQTQNWYESQKGTWRQKAALSGGGQLNDSGSHLIDIILWMTDLGMEEVDAQIETFDTEVDINAAATARLENGALLNLSVIGRSPTWCERITITGSDGAFFYQDGTIRHIDYEGEREIELGTEKTNPDRNFIDTILGRDDNRVPPECGLRVIELTEAIWEAGGK